MRCSQLAFKTQNFSDRVSKNDIILQDEGAILDQFLNGELNEAAGEFSKGVFRLVHGLNLGFDESAVIRDPLEHLAQVPFRLIAAIGGPVPAKVVSKSFHKWVDQFLNR